MVMELQIVHDGCGRRRRRHHLGLGRAATNPIHHGRGRDYDHGRGPRGNANANGGGVRHRDGSGHANGSDGCGRGAGVRDLLRRRRRLLRLLHLLPLLPLLPRPLRVNGNGSARCVHYDRDRAHDGGRDEDGGRPLLPVHHHHHHHSHTSSHSALRWRRIQDTRRPEQITRHAHRDDRHVHVQAHVHARVRARGSQPLPHRLRYPQSGPILHSRSVSAVCDARDRTYSKGQA